MTDNSPATLRHGPVLVRGGALDALRFVAAFFMVLYHYAEQAPVSLFQIHPAFSRGYLATDFFLMLSGFVLASTYGPRLNDGVVGPLQFLKSRVLRVYPAHLVMVAVFLGLYAAATAFKLPIRNPQWFDWSQLPQQVFLVQAWGFPGLSGWNIVSWSLSALIACYALFPFIWRGAQRIGSPALGLALAIGLFLAADAVSHAVVGAPIYQLALRFGVIRALPLFLIGVMLARVAARITAPKWLAVTGVLGAFVAVIGLQLIGRHDYATLTAIGVMMMSAAVWREGTTGVIRTGAAISFSLYITNYFVGVAFFAVVRMAAPRLGLTAPVLWAVWAAAPVLAVAVAWLFDRYVDTPIQSAIKSFRARRAAAVASVRPAQPSAA